MKHETRKGIYRSSKKRKLVPSKFSFDVLTEGDKALGWLLTFANSSSEEQHSCVDLYFVRQDGTMFQAEHKFRPYFYVAAKDKMEMNVDAYLRGRYQCQIADIQLVEEEDLDLDLVSHYIIISFGHSRIIL
ncbi:hypothetical protein SSX86_003400 [Deinandra increscens subsp. villosa]|uniref:DNA polymerase epsilon catalytic subunit n=1 Tax=Deinandra increscens subsp. villosa TaxID=3103831 RepID=A0AAP0DI91_9ASTR